MRIVSCDLELRNYQKLWRCYLDWMVVCMRNEYWTNPQLLVIWRPWLGILKNWVTMKDAAKCDN